MNNTLKIEDWLEFTTLPAAKTYEKELLGMMVSDETFRHDRDSREVTDLLNQGGIPRLAASDIVHNAKRYFRKQHELASAPLAIFWDAENIHIPKNLSGLEVLTLLRSTLQPFGNIVQVNVYLDIMGKTISTEKRSELQQSGCHIIDTPHMNRKEVADKMIIVDALLYLVKSKDDGATLCFITGDQDYTYLLSQIKALKSFRTILVCQNATNVLRSSPDHVLSWYDDVLKIEPRKVNEKYVLRSSFGLSKNVPSSKEDEDVLSVVSLHQDEERIQLFIKLLEDLSLGDPAVKRSVVGVELKKRYPQKFNDSQTRKDTVQRALDDKIIISGGTGGNAWISFNHQDASLIMSP